MQDKVYLVLECRLCQNKNLKKVITLAKNPIGDRFFADIKVAKNCELHNVEIMLCQNCGQMQLSEVIEPKEIYTEDYLYTTGTSVGLIEHYRRSAKDIVEQFHLPKNSFIVEIGSNEGAMLKAFCELGMQVLGIDPASISVQIAQKQGVETWCGFFNLEMAQKIVSIKGKASIVIANNVIANIPSLVDIVKGIGMLLDSKGVLVFETSYAQSVLKHHLIDTIYHEHISYFSLKPLAMFFKNQGLELFDAQEIETKGGSLRGYVAKPLCFSKTKRLEELMKSEDSFIFASHIVANSVDFEVLFKEVKQLLGEKEEFIFESFYAKAVLENNLLDMVFQEHLNYLFLAPLCKFLEKRSLNLYDAKLINSKG
ncbi:MAG: methyltransferase domain-containing protein, partial [Helicobacter sp.]|nr:methyltransferase domain-containing protein [Helicobacter sp.]